MKSKKNIAPVIASVEESKAVPTNPITPATKVSEIALKEVTETNKLIPTSRNKVNLLKHMPSVKAEKTAAMSAIEKYKQKLDRYSANRTLRANKLQSKKDAFILRIVEENKLDASFTKEMAEAMWYNKHDAKNRAIGGYTQKKDTKFEWTPVALKVKETLAKLRKDRTVTETVIAANGKSYTRSRVIKPIFLKKENIWSIDAAKKRFEEREAARKVRLANLPSLPIETPKPKKAKVKSVIDKDVKELKLTVRRQSDSKPDEYYDFKTDPFKGTLDEAIVKAKEIAKTYAKDSSFESVVIKELDANKKLIPLKVIKKDEFKAAA